MCFAQNARANGVNRKGKLYTFTLKSEKASGRIYKFNAFTEHLVGSPCTYSSSKTGIIWKTLLHKKTIGSNWPI